jgi:hypothetical protein
MTTVHLCGVDATWPVVRRNSASSGVLRSQEAGADGFDSDSIRFASLQHGGERDHQRSVCV